MSRKTVSDPRRRELIEQHKAWAALQQPFFAVLARYTHGCRLYGPPPGVPWSEFVRVPATRMVLLPDICDGEVVIPAGWRRVVGVADHGKMLAAVFDDVDTGGTAHAYYLELGLGLEIVLPGGKVARLAKQEGGRFAIEEPAEVIP